MHTVEKIGGTSMSRFGDIMRNVIIGNRTNGDYYKRIFVVSAYGGITDLLLEGKKNGKSGIYAYYADKNEKWLEALEKTRERMFELNAEFADLGLDTDEANNFVSERIDGIKSCLVDLQRLCSYGHFQLDEYLLPVREMLSAVGEAHSAWNSVQILQANGVNAALADLTGWKDTQIFSFDDKIKNTFSEYDLSSCLPIATGYTKCSEGIMQSFDRGYSEITFSKIACLTEAGEGVIHKEFHLSSGDPKLIGEEKVRVIGQTNYDVADQLADLGMEAIHPKASKGMEHQNIPIRVMNAFEPEHPGTLICSDYQSDQPRVEMVTGRKDMLGIEVWDPDMVGQSGYDYRLLSFFDKHRISYVAKNTNANTITHYVPRKSPRLKACLKDIEKAYPQSKIRTAEVAIVSAIGSNMKFPGFLAKASGALAEADINILAIDQCMRQVNMQFIVEEKDFENAIKALHEHVVEKL